MVPRLLPGVFSCVTAPYLVHTPILHAPPGLVIIASLKSISSGLTSVTVSLTGSRWTDFSSPSQYAFLTAKQGIEASPLD